MAAIIRRPSAQRAEELLRDLVSCPSAFPNEESVALRLSTELRDRQFEVTMVEFEKHRFNLYAQLKNEPPRTLFFGHMDTVPRYDGWRTEPFELTVKGDRLYGLGAWDMKAGLAAMIEAASFPTRHSPSIGILIMGDEENISKGAWHFVNNEGRYPIVTTNIGLAISGEPPIYRRADADGIDGPELVTVGRSGRGVITIDIMGRSAHGSRPEDGINALEEGAKIITAITTMGKKSHELLGTESIYTRGVEGIAKGFSVPDTARIEIEVVNTASDLEDVRRRLDSMICNMRKDGRLTEGLRAGVEIKPRETPYMQPYVADLGNPTVQRALGAVTEVLGRPANLIYARSIADDNVIANSSGWPVLRVGPAGGGAHAPNEWVSRSSLEETIEVYYAIMRKQ